jgi:hypothetical protein
MKLVVLSINTANANKEWSRDLPHPKEEPILGIQPCVRNSGCLAFVYTPAPRDEHVPASEAKDGDFDSTKSLDRDAVRRVDKLVRDALASNKGGPLDAKQVMGFTSEKALDDFLTRGDRMGNVDAGVIFQSPSIETTTFVLQCNHTKISNVEKKLMPLQVAFSQAISKEMGKPVDLDISLQSFAHPALPGQDPIDADGLAPLFLLMAFMFPFVIQMAEVVQEREHKLRQSKSFPARNTRN